MQHDVGPELGGLECYGAPMATNVRDGGDPPKHGISKCRVLPLSIQVQGNIRGVALVADEDLTEDLRWDATSPRECIAAIRDHTQRAGEDGMHLAVYQA